LHPDSEDYKADIKVTVEEHHEVEMKSGWSGKWPNWDTVHIPLRKKKLLGKSDRLVFWILNNDCSWAVLVNGIHLKDRYIKNIRNKRAPNGEDFYDIPISLCNFINLGKDGE
jgi:hypothetical protein